MDYLKGLVLSLSGGVGSYKDTVGFPGGSDGKESAYNVGDPGSIPELGGSPGEVTGYPLQYSCLENSMNREPGGLQFMRLLQVGHIRTANPCSHHVDWGGEVVSWEGMSSSGFGERSFPGNVFETFSLKSKQLTLGLTILILFLQGYLSSVH